MVVRLLEVDDFDPSIKEAIDQAARLGRNFWRRLVLPPIECWSLTSLQQRLVKLRGTTSSSRRRTSHMRALDDMLRRVWALPVSAGWIGGPVQNPPGEGKA